MAKYAVTVRVQQRIEQQFDMEVEDPKDVPRRASELFWQNWLNQLKADDYDPSFIIAFEILRHPD